MFIALVALLIVVTVPLFGGRLGALARVRIRGIALVWAALGLQVLITSVLTSWNGTLLSVVHLATYALAGAFLWLNRSLPGLAMIVTGTLLNAVTIALNGGTLPASAPALRAAGIVEDAGDFANSGVVAHPVLPWLGDIMATPSWLPERNVISIGDLVVLLGAAVMLHALTGTAVARAVRRRRRPAGRHAAPRASYLRPVTVAV